MKKLTMGMLLAVVSLGFAGGAGAAPSAVGTYGGMSADGTSVLFESTAQGVIRRIEIAGFRALVQTEIPGQPATPAVEQSTNITRAESGTAQLRANGRFSDSFVLNSRSRMDLRGATVTISGVLRGRQGTITIRLTMDKTFGDGSRQIAGGSETIQVRLTRR